MIFDEIENPLPGADWQIFIVSLTLFIIGAVLTFTPKLRPEATE
jgi:hypothetical protein